MSLLEEDKNLLGASRSESFVPSLQITAGQSAPIAANGGMSYLSRDVNGDAVTVGRRFAIKAIRRRSPIFMD